MKYVKLANSKRIDLDGLTDVEINFYLRAQKKFHDNTDWLSFDEFAFSMRSPLFAGKKSHLEVLKSPLYLALKDMSLQLGVQQGKIARKTAPAMKVVSERTALA